MPVPWVPAWLPGFPVAFLARCLREEATMQTYRAYLIDDHDRIASYRPIEADCGAEALQAARQFADGYDVEVWLLARRIGRLPRAAKV